MRFGPKVYEWERGAPTTETATFNAIDSPAPRLISPSSIDVSTP